MSLTIRNNISSLDAQRNLAQSQTQMDSVMSQLSSGFRITKAGDDAAGLGISVNLEAQIASYNQAARNANDGISVVQTAEAGMNQQSNILSRLRELAMQSASDGIGNTERGYIQTEVTQQLSELDRVANETEFNGQHLLNSAATTLDFQVGIRNVAANDRISVSTVDSTGATLGVSTIDLSTKAGAQGALSTIDAAITSLSTDRAAMGAVGNRFTNAVANIQASSESLSAADSRIRDVDVAQATSQLARTNVLMQAGVSVLAQANQQPQLALKLLQ